jgi:hypothetical protein
MLNLHLWALRGGRVIYIPEMEGGATVRHVISSILHSGVNYAGAESMSESQRKSLKKVRMACTVRTAGYVYAVRWPVNEEGEFVQGKEVCHEFVNYKGV